MSDRIQDVEDIRRTTAPPFASLACGVGGHLFRVVTRGVAPIGLECKRCCREWTIEEVAPVESEYDRGGLISTPSPLNP